MSFLSSRRGRPRLCRACGNLVGADADDCSYCGAKDRFTTGLLLNPTRLFGTFGPTRAIAAFIVAYYALMVVADRLFVVPSEAANVYRAFTVYGYTPETFVRFGGLIPALVNAGEYWRVVTPVFIHLGVIHLAFNTIALFQLGPSIEEHFGRAKLVIIFLFSGIVGAIAMMAFGQGGAGASGGLFGLIGALIAYGVRMPTGFGQAVKAQAIQWAIYGVIMSIFFNASNTAHISGLIAGFVAAYFLRPDEPRDESSRRVTGTLVWAGFAVVAISFAMMAAQVARP